MGLNRTLYVAAETKANIDVFGGPCSLMVEQAQVRHVLHRQSCSQVQSDYFTEIACICSLRGCAGSCGIGCCGIHTCTFLKTAGKMSMSPCRHTHGRRPCTCTCCAYDDRWRGRHCSCKSLWRSCPRMKEPPAYASLAPVFIDSGAVAALALALSAVVLTDAGAAALLHTLLWRPCSQVEEPMQLLHPCLMQL